MAFNRLPARKAIQDHRRRQLEDGYVFPLTATSLGQDEVWEIRVRQLSMMDQAVVNALPTATQDAVYRGMKEFEKAQKAVAKLPEATNLVEVTKNNATLLQAADRFLCAIAIEPTIVMTEAELEMNPDACVVTDIAAEDRVAVFMAVLDSESAQAKRLRLFRREHSNDVPARSDVRLVETPSFGRDGAS